MPDGIGKWGEVPEAWSDGGWDKPGLVTLDRMRSDLRTRLSNAGARVVSRTFG